jgi:hypothetical protein
MGNSPRTSQVSADFLVLSLSSKKRCDSLRRHSASRSVLGIPRPYRVIAFRKTETFCSVVGPSFLVELGSDKISSLLTTARATGKTSIRSIRKGSYGRTRPRAVLRLVSSASLSRLCDTAGPLFTYTSISVPFSSGLRGCPGRQFALGSFRTTFNCRSSVLTTHCVDSRDGRDRLLRHVKVHSESSSSQRSRVGAQGR